MDDKDDQGTVRLILVRRRTAETEMCSDYSHGKKHRKKEGIKKSSKLKNRKTANRQAGSAKNVLHKRW